MNNSITRLFLVVVLLFALLVVWTSRWTVFDATALQNNSLNKLAEYRSWTVKLGRIIADDGQVLARSKRAGGGVWKRSYPQGSLFSQPIGYANVRQGQFAGIEEYRRRALGGAVQSSLDSVFGPISTQTTGDDVYTTLDPTAQSMAKTLLNGRVGSVVAIVPQTGAVKVMYSNPSYDNNNINTTDLTAGCAPPTATDGVGCLTNLATEGLFPPGSTFKVVTTAAALNSGKYTPQSTINGNSPLTVSGVPLQNDGNQSWGEVSLTTALTNSINTVYAQVGEAVGRPLMETYMKRFGFYSTPPLDYPSAEMNTSGEFLSGKLTSVTNSNIDLGRTAIGQSDLLVTPLQMAMVVSTVADGGTLMKPTLTTKVVNPDGQIVEDVTPQVEAQVMKPSVAAELRTMMTQVVEEGTGQSANLEGLNAAGKTGTATINSAENLDDAWFIGLAPVSDPKIAVAVVLPHIVNGYGGTYAAPIAAQIMKKLLAEGF